jgi:hypothetical protein
MSVSLLREMFEQMVIRKDATLAGAYYHPEFRLTTNGQIQDYAAFAAGHERIYATDITYAVRYDDEAWVETDDRIAGRLWITTQRPHEPATEIEVILVARYLDGLLHRLWELTWPDWSLLDAFTTYDGAKS